MNGEHVCSVFSVLRCHQCANLLDANCAFTVDYDGRALTVSAYSKDLPGNILCYSCTRTRLSKLLFDASFSDEQLAERAKRHRKSKESEAIHDDLMKFYTSKSPKPL